MNCLDIVFFYYCIKRIFNRILGILKKGLGLELILSTKKNLENSSILKIINGLKGILSEYFYFQSQEFSGDFHNSFGKNLGE